MPWILERSGLNSEGAAAETPFSDQLDQFSKCSFIPIFRYNAATLGGSVDLLTSKFKRRELKRRMRGAEEIRVLHSHAFACTALLRGGYVDEANSSASEQQGARAPVPVWHSSRMRQRTRFACSQCCCSCSTAAAQSSQLNGSVTDPSGATVAEANITLTETATDPSGRPRATRQDCTSSLMCLPAIITGGHSSGFARSWLERHTGGQDSFHYKH